MNIKIRATQREDISHLKQLLDSIELFPSSMLEEMMTNYWEETPEKEYWLTALSNEQPVGLAYCAPERLTEGTYNLYAIGVHAQQQGQGIGQQIMQHLEALLKKEGQRLLIVETSGSEDFELTRKFYEQLGYDKEATLRDFWTEGEDKVIYWKKLL